MSLEHKHSILDAFLTVLDEERCTVDGCDKPKIAKGFCSAHWKRNQRYGSPTGGPPLRTTPGLPERWIHQHKNDESGPCLIWPFSRKSNGYGQLTVSGSKRYAHRLMCEAAHGTPPKPDSEAAHSCGAGKSGCVHPKHLRWASRRENEADKIIHGTTALTGERHPGAKVTDDDVIQIRSLRGVMPQRVIAARFGICQAHVSSIQLGQRRGAQL